MKTISDFLASDVQTLLTRDSYLGYANNVLSGHHDKLELTGNAFNVTFSLKGVTIENLWEDESEPLQVSLHEFIQILSNWRIPH